MNQNYGVLREPRIGILLHYDASVNDRAALAWLRDDPRCKVSYNLLIWDDGQVHEIAPPSKRAWHAGVCKPSEPRLAYRDANSAFYGVAIAATDGDVATPKQFAAVVAECARYFLMHDWGRDELWRIVGHDTEAWPRGRKHDPKGSGVVPVLDVLAVRSAVRASL